MDPKIPYSLKSAKFSVLDVEKALFKKPNGAPELDKFCDRGEHFIPREIHEGIKRAQKQKDMIK